MTGPILATEAGDPPDEIEEHDVPANDTPHLTKRCAAAGAILLGCLLVASCAGGTGSVGGNSSETGADDTDPTTTAPADVGKVDAAAKTQLDWFLGVLDGVEVDESAYEERFAEVFRQQVTHADVEQVVEQVRGAGPFRMVEVVPDSARALVATIEGSGSDRFDVVLSVDADDRIDGLLVRPTEPPELDDPPATIEEAAMRLGAMGQVRLVGTTVDDGGCEAVWGRGAEEAAPLGSVFKLYVLGAVADAVSEGELARDDQLTITAEVKRQLAEGRARSLPDGATISVLDAAGQMIGTSDNAATDLLLLTVGRDRVEQAQAAYGHTTPARNIPFLTTREMFVLKAADHAVQQRWLDGDLDTRRAVVDELADRELVLDDLGPGPFRPHELEWFATPLDVCRVLATLMERADEPGLAPIAEILMANPGVPGPEETWTTIAFKGGSEPGLVAGAWLVENAEGRRFALTASVVDPAEPLADETEAVLLMAAARDLLAAD